MVMTDIPGREEEMVTTGEAAVLIGYEVTRKQVIAMIKEGRVRAVRVGRGKWARIPLRDVLAIRRELETQLAPPGGDQSPTDGSPDAGNPRP